MLKVYQVIADVNRFQSLQMIDILWSEENHFDGSQMAGSWEDPGFTPRPAKKSRGDFWGLDNFAAFAAIEEAVEKIKRFLDESCEVLRLEYVDPPSAICHVIDVLDCLDRKRSVPSGGEEFIKSVPSGGEFMLGVDTYRFISRRFKHSLFKIPETAMQEVLCVEGERSAR